MAKIVVILKEFVNVFTYRYNNLKCILKECGELRIELQLDGRVVRRRVYKINPKYKAKVKDTMKELLDASVIHPIKKSE